MVTWGHTPCRQTDRTENITLVTPLAEFVSLYVPSVCTLWGCRWFVTIYEILTIATEWYSQQVALVVGGNEAMMASLSLTSHSPTAPSDITVQSRDEKSAAPGFHARSDTVTPATDDSRTSRNGSGTFCKK